MKLTDWWVKVLSEMKSKASPPFGSSPGWRALRRLDSPRFRGHFTLWEETPMKSRSSPRYSEEFRPRMVDLVRGGRSPESLSREFEPTVSGDPKLGSGGRPGRGATVGRLEP